MRPFDEIETDLMAIAAEWSEGFALYSGDSGAWEHLRKIELCQIEQRLRAGIEQAGGKPVETRINSEAHAHPDYVALCEKHIAARGKWAIVDLRRQALIAEMRQHEPINA